LGGVLALMKGRKLLQQKGWSPCLHWKGISGVTRAVYVLSRPGWAEFSSNAGRSGSLPRANEPRRGVPAARACPRTEQAGPVTVTAQRGAEPGCMGCARAAPIPMPAVTPRSHCDTPAPQLPPAGREPDLKWLNISSWSRRVQTQCVPPTYALRYVLWARL